MSKVLQVFYFICYGLAALAIAFMTPKIFPETPRAVAWLAGVVVFLAGALMHEIAARCYQSSLDRHRLAVLHRAYVEARDDIDRLGIDLRTLKDRSAQGTTLRRTIEPAPEMAPRAPAVSAAPDGDPVSAPVPSPSPPAAPPAAPTPSVEISSADGVHERRLLTSLVARLYALDDGNDGDGGGRTSVVSGSLIERETLNAVRDALRQGSVDVYVRPIVTLPQRKARHFDCESRINTEGGDFMPPALYMEILRANGLREAVDDMFLFRTVQSVARTAPAEPGSYSFCAVQPHSLSNKTFFDDFLEYLRETDDLVSRIAFEFRERDLIELDDAGAEALGALVDEGFHLCVSELENFDVEADRLAEGGVRFVKVDAKMLAPAVADDAEAARVMRLKSGLDDAGIDLIVTGVANEQLLVELLDFDIGYGEGTLFGDPRKGAHQPAAAQSQRGRA